MARTNKGNGSESMEDLTKKLQKLEYDVDQIVQKQNESHAEISEIKERVNASRT
jgi:peptidoglycan hydrolase CwlO-like protein